MRSKRELSLFLSTADAEFVAVAERAAAEERERAALRRRLTIARKAIQQIAETAIEHQLADRDWHYWLAEALALVLTTAGLPLDGLQAVVAELNRRRADGETALRVRFAAKCTRGCNRVHSYNNYKPTRS